jgi:hypothetical protein
VYGLTPIAITGIGVNSATKMAIKPNHFMLLLLYGVGVNDAKNDTEPV